VRYSRVEQDPLVRQLALAFQAAETTARFAGLPMGTVRGTVTSTKDPEYRGRVKVVFDAVNPEVPQTTGGGEYSEKRTDGDPDESHWIDVSPAFKGRQPETLVGKRVNIVVSNGQFQYAVLQDVLYDPETLASSAREKVTMPNNSPMTRLPVYPTDKLPPAVEENHGCMVIEEGGPMESDWLCVCLKRQGSYYWVRHIDMAHGHAGENDGKQPVDSNGDGEAPVDQQAVWDFVFPTTGGEMQKYSDYGTKPRANPFGEDAKWYEPPKSEEPDEEEVPVSQEELEATEFEQVVEGAEIQNLADLETLAFDLDVDLEEISGGFELDPNNLPSLEELEQVASEIVADFDPDNLVDPDNPIV